MSLNNPIRTQYKKKEKKAKNYKLQQLSILSEHNLKSKSFKNKPIPYPIHTAFNNMPNNVIIKNKFEIIVLNFYNFDNA